MLSHQEMDAIRRGEGNALVMRHLVNSKRNKELAARRGGALPTRVRQPDAAVCRSAQERECLRRPITHDDVVDLYRELEVCYDSAQFIALIR